MTDKSYKSQFVVGEILNFVGEVPSSVDETTSQA
jgi:hypothetical protein